MRSTINHFATLFQHSPEDGATPETVKPKRSWKRKAIFAVIVYLWFELLCFGCLQVVGKVVHLHYDPNPSVLRPDQVERLTEFLTRLRQGKPTLERLDPNLGWDVPRTESNAAGIRDDREHDLEPAPGVVRISTFGDSFTFADEVSLPESWARQITAVAPSLEVLNYGVRAYGLDQAYLRYSLEGAEYHPSLVFLDFMTENIARDVNTFRAFYANTYFPLAKPRFRVVNGQLTLVPNPLTSIESYDDFLRNAPRILKELGKHDYYYQKNYDHSRFDLLPSVRIGKILWHQVALRMYQPIFTSDGSYNVQSEAFDVTARIFDAFYAKALEKGALPVILILPDEADQIRRRKGQLSRYRDFLQRFRSKGYRFIDLQDAIEPYEARDKSGELFQPGGHYSPLTNQLVAKLIVERLKEWDLMDAAKVKEALGAERVRTASAPR